MDKTFDIDEKNVRLVRPDISFMKSYIEADRENTDAQIYEFTPLADEYKRGEEAFRRYLNLLERNEYGAELPKDGVPFSSFWLVDEKNNIFIGQSTIRHFMNKKIKGCGHIGYAIRPSLWNKGFGTKQLALLLPEARKIGLTSVRLTCYAENKQSARVMEKNGAARVGEVVSKIAGLNKATFVYEIKL